MKIGARGSAINPAEPGELAPVAKILRPPPPDEDVVVDVGRRMESAIWTPNTAVQFAWSLRDALRTRIAMLAQPTPASEYLSQILAKVESYEIDRDAANRVFSTVGRGLSPKRLFPDIEQIIDLLLQRSKGQLQVAFGELGRAKKVSGEKAPSDRTADLGRLILRDLAGAQSGPAHELYQSLSYAPPFLLGALAEAMGHHSERGFLDEIKGLDPGGRAEVVSWVRGTAESWMTIDAAEAARSRKLAPGPTQESFAELARDPNASPELKVALDRWASGLHEFFGLPEGELRLACSSRAREAALALQTVAKKLNEALGPELAGQVFGRVDRGALVAEVASLPDGVLLSTDLESPKLLAKKTERALIQFLEAGLLQLAQGYAEALRAHPDLEAQAFLSASPSLGQSSALLSMLKRDFPPLEQEGAARYLSRLAQVLREPGVFGECASRLASELKQDPTLGPEIQQHFSEHQAMAKGVAEAETHRLAQQAKLDQGVLSLPVEVLRAMEDHFRSTYPEEGLGYLVSDGRLTLFVPVDNGLQGTAAARKAAEDTEAGSRRLVELLHRGDLDLMAKVHSHPDEAPVFSNVDLSGGTKVNSTTSPRFRTVIVEVTESEGALVCRAASFRSDHHGQVVGEDRIALT